MIIVSPQKKIITNRNLDLNLTIELDNKFIENNNNTELQNINLSDFFSYEREKSKNYKLYGKIEFLSILNNLKLNYFYKEDFFERFTKDQAKNLTNSFDIYLLIKSDAYQIINNNYVYNYKVIAKPKDIDLIKCSFSKNIFYENFYTFNIKNDINIENKLDYFNKPITEFYLYFKYKNPNPVKNEKLYGKLYNTDSDEDNNALIELTDLVYDYGDEISGSLFSYPIDSFDETIINTQEYIIDLEYNNEEIIKFKYNPFIEIKIREYSDNINFTNIKLKNIINIPSYAKKIDDFNNYIWKDILEYGYIDPISNSGFDFPFINNQHYVYNNYSIDVKPDLNHTPTNNFFKEIIINSYNTNLFKQNPLTIIQTC
jgi:hypothetical protein